MTIYSPKKRGCEGAMVISRDYAVKHLEEMLSGHDMWQKNRIPGKRVIPHFLTKNNWALFNIDIPVITFKTDNNMHRRTPHEIKQRVRHLPYWGEAKELLKKYEN